MAKLSTGVLRTIVETEVLTAPEAAEYLGMTRQNISKQVGLGHIPCIRGKLFLRGDLDEYNATVKKRGPRRGGVKHETASQK
jgi:hypothetical protein